MTIRTMVWCSLAVSTPCLFSQAGVKPLEFEAATIKRDTSLDPESGSFEHGRLLIHNASLRHLIASAYDVRVDLVREGPGWIDTARFDVAAKADGATPEAIGRLMLRTFLAERFHLKAHKEQKPVPVYVLELTRQGPKFHPSAPDSLDRSGCWNNAPVFCHKATMAMFAEALRRNGTGIEIPVVDETGLTGRYELQLSFVLETNVSEPDAGPTIFAALPEQLGLKLQKAQRAIELVIVDQVQPLTAEN